MKKFNCVIVDDDDIDRLTVLSFAKREAGLNVLGAFSSPMEAMPFLENEKIDILLLDIDMPGMSGMEFRKLLLDIPVCIFITAHPEHAADSFDVDTLDFIVKPLKADRFRKAMERVEEYMKLKQKAKLFESSLGGDSIYIKEGHKQTKISLTDILYLEALKDYTLVVTSQKRYCVLSSIGTLLKEPHFRSFIRIHRSFAVQKQYISSMGTSEVELNNSVIIPIGRSFKDNLNLLQ
ncbi:LytR/AlgR family response regulator transcription factor [Flavobacterium sp. 3HN19-14]|uniref:LytR/AlgR family response regulator transcription factor n=1 Tax=Flavobacterium sp. 3HN19-14 TaxID=3448133 RepID=UPI003EE2AFA6